MAKLQEGSDFCGGSINSNKLVELQRGDPELESLVRQASEVNEKDNERYYLRNDVLMRTWKPIDCEVGDDTWRCVDQVVLPKVYRKEILHMAHDFGIVGHQGVRKTLARIWSVFYWPGIRRDVADYCKTCKICQKVGKPNQTIPVAPLIAILHFEEPFSRVLIDIVGPLPKTRSGNSYILTIMDLATRYPEAVPLRTITGKNYQHFSLDLAFLERYSLIRGRTLHLNCSDKY